MPSVINIRGPAPNWAIRPTAPGNRATHNATAFIQSRPRPISCHSGASRPNDMATKAASPAGMTTAETIGIANRLASTP